MLILVSPTKTMKEKIVDEEEPLFFSTISKEIIKELKQLEVTNIKKLMKVNDKIAMLNYERFQGFVFDHKGTKALDAYQGLQYQYMNIDTINKEEQTYVNRHLRILSGLYGLLQPNHVIYPYRLEMQTKLSVNKAIDLYALWEDKISNLLLKELEEHKEKVIVNLASNEYSKVLNEPCKKYMITIKLMIKKNGVLKSLSTHVKMGRGRFASYLIKNKVETKEQLKAFQEDGYTYNELLSNEHEYVFVKSI